MAEAAVVHCGRKRKVVRERESLRGGEKVVYVRSMHAKVRAMEVVLDNQKDGIRRWIVAALASDGGFHGRLAW